MHQIHIREKKGDKIPIVEKVLFSAGIITANWFK